MIIELDKASVIKENKIILDEISLSIEEGEHTAIIGPNGAGKTTLMKLITGDIHPIFKKGLPAVKLFGKTSNSIWDLKRKIGIITNDLQEKYKEQAAGTTGLEVVLSGLSSSIGLFYHNKVTNDNIKQAKSLMKNLDITHLENQPFYHMSSGEARRNIIARSLISDPQVLTLDEPTTGLDITAQYDLYNTMREVIKLNKTIIIITHHIEEIIQDFKQIIMIKQGKVFMQGKKEDILTTQNVSELFDVPIKVYRSDNGIYHFIR